jgi:hypothetical protein
VDSEFAANVRRPRAAAVIAAPRPPAAAAALLAAPPAPAAALAKPGGRPPANPAALPGGGGGGGGGGGPKRAPRRALAAAEAALVPTIDPEVRAAFDLQNRMRAAHGAPPLAWDVTLANEATAFLGGCPLNGSGWPGRGENMAWGYPTFSDAAKAWYAQVRPAARRCFSWSALPFGAAGRRWGRVLEAGLALGEGRPP